MKPLLLCCILLWTMSVSAQPTPGAAAKTSTTGKRVIAWVRNSVDATSGAPRLDSVTFAYGNGRGSDYDPFYLTYWPFNGSIIADFLPFENTPLRPTLLNGFSIPHVAYDSATLFSTVATSNGRIAKLCSGRRDYASPTDPALSIANVFDTLGSQTSQNSEVLSYSAGKLNAVYRIANNGSADTFTIRLISYNTAGNPVLDSFLVEKTSMHASYAPYYSTRYTYNANGQNLTSTYTSYDYTTGAMNGGSRETNTYLSSGQLYTRYYESYNLSSHTYEPGSTDTLSYLSGTNLPLSRVSTGLNTNGTPSGYVIRYSFHYNAAGKCDTFRQIQGPNGTINISSMSVISYTSDNYPASKTDYDALTAPATYLRTERYYYEPYTLGITPIPTTSTQSTISIYPNPTTGRITINHPDLKPGTPITILIANTAGQAVHAETLTSQGTKTIVTLGDEASPGIYSIRVSATGGAALYSGILLKL